MSAKQKKIVVIMGKDYRGAIDKPALSEQPPIDYAEGPIGMMLRRFADLLKRQRSQPRTKRYPEVGDRPLYFMPDWDDSLDAECNFSKDIFSSKSRSLR
jgi:hypothetical protein